MAKGVKTGGRLKGTRNKLTRDLQLRVAESGVSPLEYMLAVVRDDTAKLERRDDMAKAAAPFCHARLSSTEITGEGGGPLKIIHESK